AGELLGHVSTVEVARDMDVLRAALGEDQLDYLGASYGTFIGATYAELFPENVGRFVLDGAVDPTMSSLEMGLGQAAGFEQATRGRAAAGASGARRARAPSPAARGGRGRRAGPGGGGGGGGAGGGGGGGGGGRARRGGGRGAGRRGARGGRGGGGGGQAW